MFLASTGMYGEWLNNWIKALSQMEERKYTDAIATLKSIDSLSFLKNNPKLLTLIAECYYFNGDYEMAYNYFKRAQMIYPFMTRGIEKYAMLLFQMDKIQELEKLIKPDAFLPNDRAAEMWFIMAQYLLALHKPDKAIYIIEKSYNMNKRNVDMLLLKVKNSDIKI